MTAPGDHGEQYRDQPGRPGPWQQYQHPPVDPQAPLDYPEYPYPGAGQYPRPGQAPSPPPYGYPSPPYSGYSAPPSAYPGGYDPYRAYSAQQTNGLAIASLITSIASLPLTVICYLGLPAAIISVILGAVALNQIKQTNQEGRGLATAGIIIGAIMTAALLTLLLIFGLAALEYPTGWR